MKTEFEHMLAGVPLLSASDQREFFDTVLAMHAKATVENLAALAAGAAAVPIDKRIAKYVELRDARAGRNKAAEAIDGAFKKTLEAIEASMLADAHQQGVKGFKADAGTAYTDERMVASIADDVAFFDFVLKQGDLDFFERRIKVAHIKEWMEANDGVLPPGLNIFRELTMKVRRS